MKPKKSPEPKTTSAPHPDEKLWAEFQAILKKLYERERNGSAEIKGQLHYFYWGVFQHFQKEIAKQARAGKSGVPAPIRTLFEMADFSIPLLLWLAEHQRENIKLYARDRWAWPGYFHLSKREQNKYQALMPEFNQAGKKVKDSPIDLGKDLGFEVNANLTKGDFIFIIAARAVRDVTARDAHQIFWGDSWLWLRAHDKMLAETKPKKFNSAAEKFLLSLGAFNKNNWPKWKPVFHTYLTIKFAPPEIKFKIIPKEFQSNLQIAYQTGTHAQWFEHYRKTHRMNAVEETKFILEMNTEAEFYNAASLQQIENPDISKIVFHKKSVRSKWNALKKEILNRIENLAPSV